MSELITFTVVGLAIGSIYAIAAAGLVVTYTTTGIFNFAHGAIGMFAAYLYWQLRWDGGWGGQWPAPAALVVVLLVVAPLVGVLLQLVVMRGLEDTSETTRIVIPIAVMLAFIGIANWMWQDLESRIPAVFFGRESKWSVGDVNITAHQTIVILVAAVLAIALRFLLFRTRIGVAMRAVVDHRDLAELNGGRPDRAALISWAIGSMLAAVAGVLISPVLGNLIVLGLTLLVVNAYAAAIFGRLKSLPLTFVGGLVIGLAVSYWNWISDTGQKWNWLSEFRTTIPVVILFALLLVLPQERLRGATLARTRERFRVPTVPEALAWGAVLVAVVAAMGPLLTRRWEFVLSEGLSYGIIALSLVLLTGYAGEINLAPLAFAGIGAVAAFQFDVGSAVETGAGFAVLAVLLAIAVGVLVFPALGLTGFRFLAAEAGLVLVVVVAVVFFDGTSGSGIASRETLSMSGLIVAALVAAGVGAVVALPALRLRGLYLGLATFAFAIFVERLVFKQRRTLYFDVPLVGDGEDVAINLFNNGALNVPRPGFLGIDFANQTNMMVLLATVFAILGVGLVALRRSSYGRQLSAMKDSPAACATLGLDLVRLKLSVFTLGAAIAGFGGALHASNLRAIQEDAPFTVFEGLGLFMLTVVGGIGYVSGALVGGLLLGSVFLVMGEFWGKLADDWASLDWVFTFIKDFVIFLGPAMAGIALGRNPSGIASQFMEPYAVLKRRELRPLVVAGIAVLVGAWALRLADVIDGWTLVLIVVPWCLAWPGIGEIIVAERRKGADADVRPPELWGLDQSFSDEERIELDRALGLGNTNGRSELDEREEVSSGLARD